MTDRQWSETTDESEIFHGATSYRCMADELILCPIGDSLEVTIVQRDSISGADPSAYVAHVLDLNGARILHDRLGRWLCGKIQDRMSTGASRIVKLAVAVENAVASLEASCKLLPGPVVREIEPSLRLLKEAL